MVMARGAGCWARASGASTRTVERTERRNESFIRNDPLNGYESKRQTKKSNTGTSIDGARGEVESWSESFGGPAFGKYESTVSEAENIFAATHFFLACRDGSCILRRRARFTAAARASFP